VAVMALYSFGVKNSVVEQILYKAGVDDIVWNQQQNYAENGLSLAFTLNVNNSKMTKPDGYGEASIESLAQSIDQSNAKVATGNKKVNGKQPNVIFIMNESFWDPTLLPGVSFSEDPLPTVHRLQKEMTSGYLLSPQFGGGTSKVRSSQRKFDELTSRRNDTVSTIYSQTAAEFSQLF
jgi:phosphoglycerol transferase MdoB-like AlkP superfamily enzyme